MKGDYKEQYQNRKRRRESAQNFNVYGIVVGETYGNYKVIEKIKIPKRVSRGNGVYVDCIATAWKCIYVPTGDIKITTTGYLSEFKSKSLQDLEIQKIVDRNEHQKGFRRYLYRNSEINAMKRGHYFGLSEDEYYDLISKDCYYCGEPPRPMSEDCIRKRGNKNEPPFYYNGIDRINNDIGYIKENCVPCCPMCNYMKRSYKKEDFLKQVEKIYKHLKIDSSFSESEMGE